MRTVRQGTFETNSSSCHSITLFRNSIDWENFVDNNTVIKQCNYDMEEHVTRFNEINDENRDEYIMSFREYYILFEKEFEFIENPLNNRYTHDEVDDICFQFIKDNMSEQFLLKTLTCDGSEVAMKLDPPIKVRSYATNGPEYKDKTEINFYDVQYVLQYIKEDMSSNVPDVYIYGDGRSWEDGRTKVETYKEVPTGKKIVLVTRDEEC